MMARIVFLLLVCSVARGYHLAGGFCLRHGTTPSASAVFRTERLHVQRTCTPIIMQQLPGQPNIDSEETYSIMMRSLLETNSSVADEVSLNYNLVDYQFLQLLEKRIREAGESTDEYKRLVEVKTVINEEMANRMNAAAQSLREVLNSSTAVIMEGKIVALARKGKVDVALMDLLVANLQQAQAAGEQGKGAVAVLSKLQERVRTELDAKQKPEVALLRRLLRMDSSDARTRLLKEKMAPRKVSQIQLVGVSDSQEPETSTPEVPPTTLAEAITEIKMRFGNVDENYDSGFVQRLADIADEAEAVALDLAGGREMTSKEQQDMMWNKQFVSVWDLEAVEEEAHQNNQLAVWEEEAQQQMQRDQDARAANVLKGFEGNQ